MDGVRRVCWLVDGWERVPYIGHYLVHTPPPTTTKTTLQVLSAKMAAILADMTATLKGDPGAKFVIFSQVR